MCSIQVRVHDVLWLDSKALIFYSKKIIKAEETYTIHSKAITKDPTILQACRFTTLWINNIRPNGVKLKYSVLCTGNYLASCYPDWPAPHLLCSLCCIIIPSHIIITANLITLLFLQFSSRNTLTNIHLNQSIRRRRRCQAAASRRRDLRQPTIREAAD